MSIDCHIDYESTGTPRQISIMSYNIHSSTCRAEDIVLSGMLQACFITIIIKNVLFRMILAI